MTGEQISGGAEQVQPPAECWFANQVGWAATAYIRHTPFVQFCNGCRLTGNDLSIDYGVGQASFKIENHELREQQPPGCPGEAVNVYDAVPPPLSISRPWTEQREQQRPPGPQMPDQLSPPPSA